MFRLFGWWVCRDTGRPCDYPPRAQEELVASRLRIHELEGALLRLQRMRPTVECAECGRPYGMSHLGTCSGSLMRGGSGIVGL